MRNTNHTLQTELERSREHVSALQSHGSSLHSQFSVAETTKSVTNKVDFPKLPANASQQMPFWYALID